MSDDSADVIDAVIAHFAASPIPGAESWTRDQRGLADAFRETVLAIAAEKAAASRQRASWIQLGVRFSSTAAEEAFLQGAWAETVERWLAEGRVRWFFFMFKPPGMRIRLGTATFDPALAGEFELLLENERSANRIEGFDYGLYEAEVHQFGGEVGIELAHDFFTYDTRALLQLHRLKREGIEEEAQVLSLLVVNHLLANVCGDAWEVWDAWRNLGLLTGRRFRDDLPDNFRVRLDDDFRNNRELFELIAFQPLEALQSLAAPVRSIIEGFFARNAELAASFRAAIRERRLVFGPRTILPFFIIFHWNRWGFFELEQCFLSDSMERLFNPKNVLVR